MKIVPKMAEDAMVGITIKTITGTIITISNTNKTMAKIGNDLPGQ
jgi:hypothetical protein